MPVLTMSAAQGDTLAPWVLRVGTATSRRTACRMRGCPVERRETSCRARAGLGTPVRPIPALTSSLLATGAPPTAPPRRCAGAQPRPGEPPLPVGRDHRLASLCRVAPLCRGIRLPVAGSRPPTPDRPGRPAVAAPPVGPPDRPQHCRRAVGHRMRGHSAAVPDHCYPATGRRMTGRSAAAPGRPRHCHPVAGRRLAGPVRAHSAAAPGRPRHYHPVAGHRVTGRSAAAPGRPRHYHPPDHNVAAPPGPG
jgi:hypothetical protein